MYYKNKMHEIIYKTYIAKCPFKLPPRTLGTVYLLSADKGAWKIMKKCIEKKDVKFRQAELSGCTPYEYTLIKAAYDIYEDGITHISIYDLGDKFLISNKTLELIFQAIRIARDGYEALDVEKKFN